MNYPEPPAETTFVAKIGGAMIACDPVPPRPGIYRGHPEDFEPPEPGELVTVYLLLHSASKTRPDRWVPASLECAEHLEEQIWAAYSREVDEAWAAYADEMNAERFGL